MQVPASHAGTLQLEREGEGEGEGEEEEEGEGEGEEDLETIQADFRECARAFGVMYRTI